MGQVLGEGDPPHRPQSTLIDGHGVVRVAGVARVQWTIAALSQSCRLARHEAAFENKPPTQKRQQGLLAFLR